MQRQKKTANVIPMENLHEQSSSGQRGVLNVSARSAEYLKEIGKWGKLLAIFGFCAVAVVAAAGLFAASISAFRQPQLLPYPGLIVGILYVGLGVIYFFPFFYLFRFTRHMKKALLTRNDNELDAAFENLKSHYKFTGILVIITLAAYILFGGGALLMGLWRQGLLN